MNINNDITVTLAEAEQDFSEVTRLVDENGSAVILKNNVPRYVVIEYSEAEDLSILPDDEVDIISDQLIKKNLPAYKELAK